MKKVENSPFDLDWGEVFVESYNIKTKNATLVYNFNFEAEEFVEDYFNYSVAHLYWVYKNLPLKSSITIIYDLRGVTFDADIVNDFEGRLKNHVRDIDKSIKANFVFHK